MLIFFGKHTPINNLTSIFISYSSPFFLTRCRPGRPVVARPWHSGGPVPLLRKLTYPHGQSRGIPGSGRNGFSGSKPYVPWPDGRCPFHRNSNKTFVSRKPGTPCFLSIFRYGNPSFNKIFRHRYACSRSVRNTLANRENKKWNPANIPRYYYFEPGIFEIIGSSQRPSRVLIK